MKKDLSNTGIALVTELPDSVRIPLHSLQADLESLIGRVIADRSCGSMVVKSMRDRLNQIEAALVSPPSEAGRDKAGSIPEQETWWLVEREGTGLYAVGNGQYPDWSPDPWRAYRYDTARAADNARLRIAADSLRDGSIATEHVFINKMPRALSRPDQGTVAVSSAERDGMFTASEALRTDPDAAP